jgi:hypothetical protein
MMLVTELKTGQGYRTQDRPKLLQSTHIAQNDKLLFPVFFEYSSYWKMFQKILYK